MSRENSHILPIDSVRPNSSIIETAAAVIDAGGLVVFPTNTFYGLGAKAFDQKAVAKVYAAKKRDLQKPLLVLIASDTELPSLVCDIPGEAVALMRRFWPGNVTLVFEARPVFPDNLTGGTGKIGVRLAGHPVAQALVKGCGYPVTATSANLTGQAGCAAVRDLDGDLLASVNAVLDAGTVSGIAGSTVIDVTVSPPRILREGIVRSEDIEKVLKKGP